MLFVHNTFENRNFSLIQSLDKACDSLLILNPFHLLIYNLYQNDSSCNPVLLLCSFYSNLPSIYFKVYQFAKINIATFIIGKYLFDSQ